MNVDILGPAGFIRIKNNAIHFGIEPVPVASSFNDLNQDMIYSAIQSFSGYFSMAAKFFSDERATAAVNAYSEIYAGYGRSIKLGDDIAQYWCDRKK